MFTKRPICVVLFAVMAPVPAWVGSAVASYTSQGRAAPSPYTAGQDEAVKAGRSAPNQPYRRVRDHCAQPLNGYL